MPKDSELKQQLASVRYQYRDGLLLMEPKKAYKERLGKSPDRADSFVLTFAPAAHARRRTLDLPDSSGSWQSA